MSAAFVLLLKLYYCNIVQGKTKYVETRTEDSLLFMICTEVQCTLERIKSCIQQQLQLETS